MAFSNYSGNLVGGESKLSSSLTTEKTSSQYGGIKIIGAIIIFELYMDNDNAYSALGLRSGSDKMNPATSYDYSTYPWATYNDTKYCTNKSYDFKAELGGRQIYVDPNEFSESSTRKVFSLHSSDSSRNIYPAHLLYGPIIKYSSSSTAYFGYSFGNKNEWLTHTDGDGNIYKAITVNSNNQFIQTTLSVKKGKKYTFNMHTVSEAGYDGIIISTSPLTSGSVKNHGIARCHGVDAKSTYTYTPTSDGTIYIYFKTDSTNLGESHTSYDSHLGEDITTYDGFTTGDIEIIVEPITTTTTIFLNLNGGTASGQKAISIRYGANVSDITLSSLPQKTGCRFKGYYTGSSRNNPGTMYIDSNGRGVSGKTWDITDAECTLYALYDYEPEILQLWYPLHCVYCTSSPASASTLQTDTAISLGILGSSIDGTFSYTVMGGGPNRLPDTIQDDTTLIVPAGTASGDYIFSIRYDFTPTDTSVFSKSKTTGCDIWVISTYLVDEVMDLESLTYLEQKKDIPAGSFTLNSNNVSEYFQYPIAIPSTTQIIYNNGQTETSAPRMNWSMYQPITFTSLGTTITSRQQVAIPDNSDIRLTIPIDSYRGEYYDTDYIVREIISMHVSSGVAVGYFSQLRDLNITFNDYTDFLNDLNAEYGIKIDGDKARMVHSVDLLCKYLYVYHNVGSKAISTGGSMPIIAKYGTQTGDKVYREANTVDSLSLSVEESSINVGDKTFADTKALFKSGDEISVNGTYSGYDSSIISINKTAAAICVDNIPNLNDYELEFSKIYGYYGQYNGNYLFKRYGPDYAGAPEYIVTDSIDFDVLLHASYNYNGQFTTPTHIIGRLNADMSNYNAPIEEVRILDVY